MVELVLFCAMGYVGYTAHERMTMSEAEKFMLANVEALTNLEDENPSNYSDCLSAGGNWNMASVCTDTGFEDVVCKINGEINLFGVVIKGNYEKGRKYKTPWARYSCQPSNGNCCVKQGLYSGSQKLA